METANESYKSVFDGPCGCRFHVSCTKSNHNLTSVDLRTKNYRDNVLYVYGSFLLKKETETEKTAAVDHIIELWEVKRAYYRAVVYFEQLSEQKMKDFIKSSGISGLAQFYQIPLANINPWIPTTEDSRLQFLKSLREIFNSSINVCLIDDKLNNAKCKFLEQTTRDKFDDIVTNTVRREIFRYYRATDFLRTEITKALVRQYANTGNILFAAIQSILLENYRDFVTEALNFPKSDFKSNIKTFYKEGSHASTIQDMAGQRIVDEKGNLLRVFDYQKMADEIFILTLSEPYEVPKGSKALAVDKNSKTIKLIPMAQEVRPKEK